MWKVTRQLGLLPMRHYSMFEIYNDEHQKPALRHSHGCDLQLPGLDCTTAKLTVIKMALLF
jgi:hypothetical protein